MISRRPSPTKNTVGRRLGLVIPALALVFSGTPSAQPAAQDIDIRCQPQLQEHTFPATPGTPLDAAISAYNNGDSPISWTFNPRPEGCSGEGRSYVCNGVAITLPAELPSPHDSKVTVKGTPSAIGSFHFTIHVEEDPDGDPACNRDYELLIEGPAQPQLGTGLAPAGPFGKAPDDSKTLTVTNQGATALAEVGFAVNCPAAPCLFQAPPNFLNLGPGASRTGAVRFSASQAAWMRDYSATLVVTVPKTDFRKEIALSGNKGQPLITPQPGILSLSEASALQGTVTLNNEENERLANLGIALASCGSPCPFSLNPSTLTLEAKGDAGQQDSKDVTVDFAPNDCYGGQGGRTCTALLKVSVPGLAQAAATASIEGVTGPIQWQPPEKRYKPKIPWWEWPMLNWETIWLPLLVLGGLYGVLFWTRKR